jgi:hypothetical protein
MSNVYSSRKIEALLLENINFMWLSGRQTPDHNTINRFRSERLKTTLKSIFTEIALLMNKSGLLDISEIYTDGTKIESAANKYTFVWRKAIRKSKERMLSQINQLWDYAETVTQQELLDVRPTCYQEVDAAKINETISAINAALADQKIEPKVRQKLTRVKKAWPEQLERYKISEEIFGERNSYSKTDKDATFMRMKEDHMLNGQLKPGYNVQISTNNQMIVDYTIHQTPGDTTTLIGHLEDYAQTYNQTPTVITADAGYGCQENYEYLEARGIEPYVKYNNFHKEKTKKFKRDISKPENLYYDKEKDIFYCPMGQKMHNIGEGFKKTSNGYKYNVSKYQASNCSTCPLVCHHGKGNRIMEINWKLWKYKEKINDKLCSLLGLQKRGKRATEPETVFGNIKSNKGFRRFMLRGLEKVSIEFGLIAISHNLAKICV